MSGPTGRWAAARATPTGARGNVAGAACQARVAGSNTTCGRTWATAVSWRPAEVITVTAPLVALSGTVTSTERSVQDAESTGAARPAKVTAPGVAPKPKPSMTTDSPRTRIGSIAPAT